MAKAKSNITSLLSAIQRKAPAPEQQAPEPVPAAKKADQRVHLWFQPEDHKTVRELAAWLAGQGERPSDSLIVRTALRMASPGGDFLQAYRDASKTDGRRKRPLPRS